MPCNSMHCPSVQSQSQQREGPYKICRRLCHHPLLAKERQHFSLILLGVLPLNEQN